MSREQFDDACAGCRPVMVDVKTGSVYADDSVEMVIVNRLWSETTLEERQAWHRFTCQSSRTIEDLRLAKAFTDRIAAAFAAAGSN
jgi:hypothetical protein